MSFTYEQLHTLAPEQRYTAAQYISRMVCQEAAGNKMKEVEPDELLARWSLIAFDGLKIIGHVSTKAPHFVDDVWRAEVAALWSHTDYRKMGIARDLVGSATKHLHDNGIQPEAICNEFSMGAFRKWDYEPTAPDPNRPDRVMMLGPVPVISIGMVAIGGRLTSIAA